MRKSVLVGLVFAITTISGIAPAAAETVVTPTSTDQVPPSTTPTFVVFSETLPAKPSFAIKETPTGKWVKIEARKVKTPSPCDTCWELQLPETVSLLRVADSASKKALVFVLARVEPTAPISAIPYDEVFGDTNNKNKDNNSALNGAGKQLPEK